MASLQVQAALAYLQTILTPRRLRELRAKLCANCWQFLLRRIDTHFARRGIVEANSREEAMRLMLTHWELVGFILVNDEGPEPSEKLLEVIDYYTSVEGKTYREIDKLMRKKFGSVKPYVEDVLKILNANVGGVFLLELTNDIGKQIRHA